MEEDEIDRLRFFVVCKRVKDESIDILSFRNIGEIWCFLKCYLFRDRKFCDEVKVYGLFYFYFVNLEI